MSSDNDGFFENPVFFYLPNMVANFILFGDWLELKFVEILFGW